jgi:hypothetical protein
MENKESRKLKIIGTIMLLTNSVTSIKLNIGQQPAKKTNQQSDKLYPYKEDLK